MLADIKGPHLDFFWGGPNSLSHGSADISKIFNLTFWFIHYQ